MENPLSKAFNGWKIFLAIAIGLLISSWMLYNSLSTSQFISDSENGTHEWVDGNHNKRVDVTNEADLASLESRVREHFPEGLDGVVHSIGFAPEAALGGNFLNTSWEDVATAVHVSAYSLKSLAMACRPTFKGGASIVGLDFDAQVAWPKYDWMGVAKAALESTSRYLARDLGAENVRINLVAAGPIRTMAAKSIPGFDEFEKVWNDRSPLEWDVTDPVPAAKAAVALLSDWFPKTTAEIIHVDGGLHGMGA